TGRGNLPYSIEWGQHPGSDVELVAAPDIEVHIGNDASGDEGIEALPADPRTFQRRPLPALRHEKRQADRGDLGLVRRDDDVLRGERHGGGEDVRGDGLT